MACVYTKMTVILNLSVKLDNVNVRYLYAQSVQLHNKLGMNIFCRKRLILDLALIFSLLHSFPF